MCLRVYFPIRTALNYSVYTDAYSKKLSWNYGFNASFMFSLRCYVHKKSIGTILTLMSFSLFVFAYVIRIFEEPLSRIEDKQNHLGGFQSFFSAYYFVFIAMSTIGFGDINPGTPMGRLITIAVVMWGFALVSLFLDALLPHLSISEDQALAYHHINLTRKAAITI